MRVAADLQPPAPNLRDGERELVPHIAQAKSFTSLTSCSSNCAPRLRLFRSRYGRRHDSILTSTALCTPYEFRRDEHKHLHCRASAIRGQFRGRIKVRPWCPCSRILIGPVLLAIVLAPGHKGPNLKLLRSGEDGFLVSEGWRAHGALDPRRQVRIAAATSLPSSALPSFVK